MANPEPAGEAPQPGRVPAPRRRRHAVLVTVAAATLTVAVLAAAKLPRAGDNLAETAPPPRCPSAPAGAFTGVTYGAGAHVRAGATRDASILTTIPPRCTVGFTGFCIGDKVYDNTGGTPDVRWFKVAGGGVVSSAVIHGNPPRALQASDCPNGRPTSTDLAFQVVADPKRPGAVTLRATGRDLYIVGFATSAGPSATPGSHSWRQVSLSDVPDPAMGAWARLEALAAPSARRPVVLVAAACLGGDSPTRLVRAWQVHPTDLDRAVPVKLDPEQQGEAATSACRYPSGG